MPVLKLQRIRQSCVMYWLGPWDVWKASNRPKFTGSYRCFGDEINPALEDMQREFIQNGYQAEIIDDQTAESIQKYWRAA